MDEDTLSMTETSEPGIRASQSVSSPTLPSEPPIFSVRSDTGSQTDRSRLSRNRSLLIRKDDVEHAIELPSKITSHTQFVESISTIRKALTGSSKTTRREAINRAYYVLAWLVGDATKRLGSRKRLSGYVGIELCRRHPENLDLGNYVAKCLRTVGIECTRRSDRQPDYRDPHGQYRWLSLSSPVVGWMHMVCLGLKYEQLTSYHPVHMNWVLTAPFAGRLWFIRGLFDSDGSVLFRNKSVEIVSSPNSKLIMSLLDSMKVHNRLGDSKAYDKVIISVRDAARIQVFNSNVLTHRRKALQKLLSARTFQRHWPPWLHDKVNRLIREGLNNPAICHRIFDEDNVYIKTKTVKIKRGLLS